VFVSYKSITRDQNRVHALFTHLTRHKAGFCVVATDIKDVDALLLQLGNKRRIVLFTGSVGFVEHGRAAGFLVDSHSSVGQALAIRRLIVDEGYLLASEMLHEELAGDVALLIIAAADAEDVVARTLVGEVRIGGCRRNLQDALFSIDLRCGYG